MADITIMGMAPEELVEKAKAGNIESRTFNSVEEFIKALREE